MSLRAILNFVYLLLDAHYVIRTTKISIVESFLIRSFLIDALSVLSFSSTTLCFISFFMVTDSSANLRTFVISDGDSWLMVSLLQTAMICLLSSIDTAGTLCVQNVKSISRVFCTRFEFRSLTELGHARSAHERELVFDSSFFLPLMLLLY